MGLFLPCVIYDLIPISGLCPISELAILEVLGYSRKNGGFKEE